MPFGSSLLNAEGPRPRPNMLQKETRNQSLESAEAGLSGKPTADPISTSNLGLNLEEGKSRYDELPRQPSVRNSNTLWHSSQAAHSGTGPSRHEVIIEHYNYISHGQSPQIPPYNFAQPNLLSPSKTIPGSWPSETVPSRDIKIPVNPNRHQKPITTTVASEAGPSHPKPQRPEPMTTATETGPSHVRLIDSYNPKKKKKKKLRTISEASPCQYPTFDRAPISHAVSPHTSTSRPQPQTYTSEPPLPTSISSTVTQKKIDPNTSIHNLYFANLLLVHHTLCCIYIPPSRLPLTAWELKIVEPDRFKVQQYSDVLAAIAQLGENARVLAKQAIAELTKDVASPDKVLENYSRLVEMRDILVEAIDNVKGLTSVEKNTRGRESNQQRVHDACDELTKTLEVWKANVQLMTVDMDRRLNL